MDTLFEDAMEYSESCERKISNIFKNVGKWQFNEKKKRGITNERQSVLKEIQTEMEKDGPVNVRLLAIRLSHIPTGDLYFMKSEASDYRSRGKGEFSKYIWGSIKVRPVDK
jgi:hypothetical protein